MERKIRCSVLDFRVLLCLFLVWCIILCPLGEVHQKAQAIVGVDDALIGILIAGLAAVGITFVSTGAYNTLTEYVGSLLDQYAGSIGTTGQGLFTGVQTGANGIGQILVNNRMVMLISSFAEWIWQTFTLSNNSEKTLVSSDMAVEINGVYGEIGSMTLRAYVSSNTTGKKYRSREFTAENNSAPVFFYTYRVGTSSGVATYGVGGYSISPFTVSVRTYFEDGDTTETTNSVAAAEYGLYWFSQASASSSGNSERITLIEAYNSRNSPYGANPAINTDMTFDQSRAAIGGEEIPENENQATIGVNTGVLNLPVDDSNYQSGDGAVIDVSAPWGMTYPDIVNKWLPKEWAPEMSGNPSITYNPPTVIDDQVASGPETAQVSTDPGEYAVPGLQSVFPFCIPFDIYNFLSVLAADPVAPSFTWRFYLPGICDENVTIDLSPFDTVAQIVRTVELLAFIIGLAMVTRERFLRG